MALFPCFRQAPFGAAILAEFPFEWHRLSDGTTTRSTSTGSCPLDITETEGSFHIKADAPGLEKSDIKVEVRENRLILEGERQEEKREEEEGVTHRERSHRSFRRVLRLPKNADVENIQATLDKGVLMLTIAKKDAKDDAENVKRIEIN